MKRFLLTLCVWLACTVLVVAQNDTFTIEGHLDASINGKLLLVVDAEKGLIDIGDAVVTNGVFKFTGRMPEATMAYIMPVKKDVVLGSFMLENANYTIEMGMNELVVNGGGEAQKIWNEFVALDKQIIANQQELEMQAQANPALVKSLQQKFDKFVAGIQEKEVELLKKHSNTIVAAYVVSAKISMGFDEVKLKALYDLLGENAKSTFYGKRVADELARVQKIAIGAIAPNFTAPLADGGVLSLHETKGKVKIVDFWASWCAPCRQENVNLIQIYKRFRPKGLEIISVSLDNNKQNWLTAIGQDGCEWKNVSDLKGEHSEIAAEYCVKGIPCTFILDEENRIIAKNLRGKELEKFVESLLKKKKD